MVGTESRVEYLAIGTNTGFMGVVANGEAIGMADEATSRTDVFVYGTLTDRDRVDDLLESFCFVGDAVIEGLHVVEGDYPTLAPGGRPRAGFSGRAN